LIPFIYHLNLESKEEESPIITNWIYTEAQTGRTRLDTHFSYLNLIFKSYVEDGNDIILEEQILDALAFCGGVAGTTGVLINCENLNGSAIKKKFKPTKIGSRATHELRWYDNKIEIYESSGITVPEQIMAEKLKKHARIPLGAIVEKVFSSETPP
jgi:hypothetical protein